MEDVRRGEKEKELFQNQCNVLTKPHHGLILVVVIDTFVGVDVGIGVGVGVGQVFAAAAVLFALLLLLFARFRRSAADRRRRLHLGLGKATGHLSDVDARARTNVEGRARGARHVHGQSVIAQVVPPVPNFHRKIKKKYVGKHSMAAGTGPRRRLTRSRADRRSCRRILPPVSVAGFGRASVSRRRAGRTARAGVGCGRPRRGRRTGWDPPHPSSPWRRTDRRRTDRRRTSATSAERPAPTPLPQEPPEPRTESTSSSPSYSATATIGRASLVSSFERADPSPPDFAKRMADILWHFTQNYGKRTEDVLPDREKDRLCFLMSTVGCFIVEMEAAMSTGKAALICLIVFRVKRLGETWIATEIECKIVRIWPNETVRIKPYFETDCLFFFTRFQLSSLSLSIIDTAIMH